MPGLYIHIPFCRKACTYCDFHFSTSLAGKEEVVKAICAEMELQKHFLPSGKLTSIYFGGGTPSVLSQDELSQIFSTIEKHFSIEEEAEITLEANPDDLTQDKLIQLAGSPVNRLSVGVQSFRNEDLKMMNRTHSVQQAKDAVKKAQDVGFTNLTLDLIYAIPGMSNETWEHQIEQALELEVPHISSYALTVEPKTALAYKIKKGDIQEAGDETAAEQFAILWKTLRTSGFTHYEVSNFARPGSEAVHNSAYWQSEPYLGIGPSAHSFRRNTRQWNVSNNHIYVNSLRQGKLCATSEELSAQDLYNEMVMISLRTERGLDLKKLENDFSRQISEYLLRESQVLLSQGKLVREGHCLYIPQGWRFHSDGIASSLFYI